MLIHRFILWIFRHLEPSIETFEGYDGAFAHHHHARPTALLFLLLAAARERVREGHPINPIVRLLLGHVRSTDQLDEAQGRVDVERFDEYVNLTLEEGDTVPIGQADHYLTGQPATTRRLAAQWRTRPHHPAT